MFEQIHAKSQILHQALDGLSARQRVTAHNMANGDTPGYNAQEVRFESALKQKIRGLAQSELDLTQSNQKHLSLNDNDAKAFTIHELWGQMRNDQNGVDIEQEVTRMAQAQLSYTAVSQQLAGAYSQLKYVISEGGR